jgi:hydroxypyruvate isomerase
MHGLQYAANCSLLFTELPLLQRPAAAYAAGFRAVEFWWPWPSEPVPSDRDLDAFVTAVADSGVRLVGLNFFAGDLAGPDCGVLSIPGRAQDFLDNVEVTIGIGERLGVGAFNALYGNRVPEVSPEVQDELGTENLVHAATAAERIGATVLVEPVSGPKPYPLRTAADVAAVIERVRSAGPANVGLLFDLFHLANNGDDLDAAVARYQHLIAHVQVADHPGRNEPGAGSLDLDRHLSAIEAGGYSGYVALEYVPSTTTPESLAWLPVERRGFSAS